MSWLLSLVVISVNEEDLLIRRIQRILLRRADAARTSALGSISVGGLLSACSICLISSSTESSDRMLSLISDSSASTKSRCCYKTLPKTRYMKPRLLLRAAFF